MGQRLGIATALLGDPEILVLDEPTNGLDPDGILWLRTLLSRIAAEGRTVFLSSHLMSELALIAEDLVVIGGGELLAVGSVDAVVASVSPETVRVITPEAGALARALQGPGVSVSSTDSETLDVQGLAAREIGSIAAGARIVLYGLETHQASLEEAFMQITQGAPVHGAHLQEVAE